ncbi:CLUMA_CG003683, isoform A [Clunio marinus]|uniref:CLUMA_CG003683, isoform A n=1 Tax=Clunio marinus TaxID=568069 RepID=A0A1J1HPR3_9DIPT|nr:CLUMA_CG003683, isoform A [Clunio marinus]
MKKIIGIVFTLIVNVLTTEINLDEICDGILYSSLMNPSDSNSFIGCAKGKGTIYKCDHPDEVFDSFLVSCIKEKIDAIFYQDEVIADFVDYKHENSINNEKNYFNDDFSGSGSGDYSTTEPSTTSSPPSEINISFVCPLSGYGKIPSKYYCETYYECILGIQYFRQCPDGEIFDIITSNCGDPKTSLCGEIIRCI